MRQTFISFKEKANDNQSNQVRNKLDIREYHFHGLFLRNLLVNEVLPQQNDWRYSTVRLMGIQTEYI